MGLFSKQTPTFDPAKDLPDLTGKVIIVTGGNSGIGFTTVQHLARRGAKVYIATRNEARAKAAIERLRAQGLEPGNGEVDWFELDLSDLHKTKKSAESFIQKEKRLDVLINNAGIQTDSYKKDNNGIIDPCLSILDHVEPLKLQRDYGTRALTRVSNEALLSPAVFTATLLPLLTQTAKETESDVRIVFVSTQIMEMLKGRQLRFGTLDDLNEQFSGMFAPLYRYAKSKLAALLYLRKLQEKLDADGIPITVLALHPGAVNTEALSKDPMMNWPIIGPTTRFVLKKVFMTPSQGAYASAFAAASPMVKTKRDKYKNAFLHPPAKIGNPPHRQAHSQITIDEVWNITQTLLQQWGV